MIWPMMVEPGPEKQRLFKLQGKCIHVCLDHSSRDQQENQTQDEDVQLVQEIHTTRLSSLMFPALPPSPFQVRMAPQGVVFNNSRRHRTALNPRTRRTRQTREDQ